MEYWKLYLPWYAVRLVLCVSHHEREAWFWAAGLAVALLAMWAYCRAECVKAETAAA